MLDVEAEELAGSRNVALPAKFKYLVMLFIGALNAVRQVQLQPGIALPAVIHVANNVHEMGPLGARIQERMELPV